MFARKDGLVRKELSKYASNGPDINWNKREVTTWNAKQSSHDSLALKYAFGFNIISGARYQRVATYSVSTPLWS